MPRVRAIAFYLPQYHPIPENDNFWGKGFTEWTNVARAKPLFVGHAQPDLPSDLGFYDLRVPETRELQAQLAHSSGIEAFCYWHYWFGGGKRALERIFEEVLETGSPDFPFCLAWANQSWTGKWHGLDDNVIFRQDYPGQHDYADHFYSLLDAFRDRRYVKVNGKPLFLIYRPSELPEPGQFVSLWNELALREGLPGIHFVSNMGVECDGRDFGFNGACPNGLSEAMGLARPSRNRPVRPRENLGRKLQRKLIGRNVDDVSCPSIYLYPDYATSYPGQLEDTHIYPTILTNWDNTPRSGRRGVVFLDPSADLFEGVLRKACNQVADRPYEERLIFIKSWNEWAEGNYLEPSLRHGNSYLQTLQNCL